MAVIPGKDILPPQGLVLLILTCVWEFLTYSFLKIQLEIYGILVASMSQSNSSSSLYPLHWISFTSKQWDIGDAVNLLSDETVPEKDIYPLSPHMCPSFGFLWTYWPMNMTLQKNSKYICLTICQAFLWTTHTHTHPTYYLWVYELLYHLYRREIWIWKVKRYA